MTCENLKHKVLLYEWDGFLLKQIQHEIQTGLGFFVLAGRGWGAGSEKGSGQKVAVRINKKCPSFWSHCLRGKNEHRHHLRGLQASANLKAERQASLKSVQHWFSGLTTGIPIGTSVYSAGIFHLSKGFKYLWSLLIMFQLHVPNTVTTKYTLCISKHSQGKQIVQWMTRFFFCPWDKRNVENKV